MLLPSIELLETDVFQQSSEIFIWLKHLWKSLACETFDELGYRVTGADTNMKISLFHDLLNQKFEVEYFFIVLANILINKTIIE